MNLLRRIKHKIRSYFIVVGPQGPPGVPGLPGKDHSQEIAELHERVLKLEKLGGTDNG